MKYIFLFILNYIIKMQLKIHTYGCWIKYTNIKFFYKFDYKVKT